MIPTSIILAAACGIVIGFSAGLVVGEHVAEQHGTTILVREAQK